MAGVVYKGQLVSLGYNSYKSHPYQARWGRNPDSIFLHAEVEATLKALKVIEQEDLRKSYLLVARLYKSGLMANSCPCPGCLGLIDYIGYKHVFYTTPKGWEWLKKKD